ncbi:MAG: xanthine dehydrogenase family protein molybdopterin-binding subunit [Planctomycetes bacterium]|nr:xanthine dehydrogenase family protein molybdopterin-binding subunit [Planctomycetota bacterium]
MKSPIGKIGRRELLVAGGAGGLGLVLGIWYGTRRERWRKNVPEREGSFSPNVYLAIETDGSVRIWVNRSELGQGVWTALPMLVADGLDADWSRVQPVQPLASRNYGVQFTAVSSSVRSQWQVLRQSGAAARAMLMAAAAKTWGCAREECATEAGFVVHSPSGRRLGYGQLALLASREPVPEVGAEDDLPPRLLGRSLPRKDLPAKVDGSARFGLDVRLPGMVFAALARPPRFGARLRGVSSRHAESLPGVRQVVTTDHGVAVVAVDTWTALRARDALELDWEPGPHVSLQGSHIERDLRTAIEGDLATARTAGTEPAEASRTLHAEYEVPFLAHAPMEPINCTVWLHDGRCDIWAPTQAPGRVQLTAMELLGLSEPSVSVRPTFVGGGFGRRVHDIEVREAVAIARKLTTPAPLQLVWSRTDDLRHDLYRPCALHRLTARLGDGALLSWQHRIAAPSIIKPAGGEATWVDPVGVEGAVEFPYATPHVEVRYRAVPTPVPLGFWRSVGHSYNAFAVECFIDEVAEALGRSPAALRRELLHAAPRHRGVLDAVERSAALVPLSAGRARGLAVHASFESYVAMIAEVGEDDQGIRVHRVFCAVDCGRIVHPDLIASQIEGGIVFGLSAALFGRITIEDGAVVESGFLDYRLATYSASPEIHVEILSSRAAAGGVGEIGVPPIAPAVVNALSRLRGERVRRLPLC